MLCSELHDPLGVEGGGSLRGLGLIDSVTVFQANKIRTRVTGVISQITGIFSKLAGNTFEGYEIHMGTTNSAVAMNTLTDLNGKVRSDGATDGNIYGTYVHGIFDSEGIVTTIVSALADRKGIDIELSPSVPMAEFKNREYDKLANLVRNSLDMELIYSILNEGV